MKRHLLAGVVLVAVAAPSVAAAAGGEPDVTLPTRTVPVGADGRFSVQASCDPGGEACAGDLRLYTTSQAPRRGLPLRAARATRLGLVAFELRPGEKRRLTVRLNAAGRRALARRSGRPYRVRVRLRMRESDGSFRALQQTTIDLRAAR